MKFLFSLLVIFPFQAMALTPDQVVQSSFTHFPQVIEAMQKLEQRSFETKSARGAFDGKVVGKVDSRTEGYYNGDAYKLSIEKPLSVLNSKVYVGKRQGFGDFPTYEGKYETRNQGEVFAGLSLSLLRDAMIDGNRYHLRYLRQSQEQAEYDLRLMKINVQTMALKAYWMCYIKGLELKVHKSILALAENRAQKIARRIKVGDLAKIYGTENDQYVTKRRVQVSQSLLEFQEAAYYLSLFYRDNNGQPILLSQSQFPSLENQNLTTIADSEKIFQRALDENLELKILNSKEKQAALDIQLGKNQILPKLDVKLEWNQDQGIGPARLAQDENRVLLNLEVPFQFRKGIGKREAGEAKRDQIQTKKRWTTDKLKTKVQTLVAKLNGFAQIYKLTDNQVKLASQLADAERRKFFQGASDLILVNIREENLAEAQAKNLASLLKYNFIDADLKNIQVLML